MALAFVASVASMVSKIGEYLAPHVGRQFGYLIFYNRNIENLEKQVQQLKDKKDGTQRDVEAAKRKNEIIGADVEWWLKTAEELGKEVNNFLEVEVKANKGCLNEWCPNLKSRYSLSKKAKNKTKDVAEECVKGNFLKVSHPATPVEITFASTEGFKAFESRRSIMKEVMEALADDSINMIGICGMGGVGKTTLVKEVAQKAKENNLFNKIAIAVVSQKPDQIKIQEIQGAIAEHLGFESFDKKDLLARASDLRQRILSSEKVLIILDDVWERLDLNQIGIPFGNDHKGCKIVLTTRSEDVCNDMRTQKKIEVKVLHEEEAWNLFKVMAGISNDTSHTTDLHSKQKAVANECGGLPIAIVTVGRALNGRDKPSWDNALNELQKAIVENIRGVDDNVFQSLELSYNYLKSEEARKLFLCCSLFPEDFRIQIEDLVRYGIGLKLFKGIITVDDARNRVHALVDDLMKCYLLMGDEKGVSIRMHDVIRDVATSIASRKEHSFMVRCDEALKEWLEEDRHENYTAISLRCTAMRDLPNNLKLPKLMLLRLEYNDKLPKTPDYFYQEMKELKVVDLSDMDVHSLPASLRCLTNLRTLSLYCCELSGDISVIGALKNLEILSFSGSTMKELPKEIANLTRLKLLDLIRCSVERISPGVLSSLSRLEELYVRTSFPSLSRLEEEEQEIISDVPAASITELASLSYLVALDIHIEFWPKDFVLGKVKKFRIFVGQQQYASFYCFDSYLLKNQLRLYKVDASNVMESGVKMLLKSTEILELDGIAGLKNIPCDSYKDIFEYLKELSVDNCGDLEYLINTTTEDDDDDDDDDDEAVPQRAFPVLEVLKLHSLYNFKGIICDGQQQLSKKKNEGELQNLPQIPHHNKIGGPRQLDRFCNLTTVQIRECDMVESLFDLSMARGLVQLRTLDIFWCEMMESIVSSSKRGGEHEKTTATIDPIEFPKLQKLDLCTLPSLIAFSKAVNAIELPQLNELNLSHIPKLKSLYHSASESNYDIIIRPLFDKKSGPTQLDWLRNLTSVEMRRCDMVESMFLLSMARGLVQLQTLYIDECEMMESIVCSSEGGREHEITAAEDPIEFPKLQKLTLTNLPSFIAFCKVVNAIELPQLNELDLTNIPKLKSLCHTASESNCDTIIQPLFKKKSGPTQLGWLRNLTLVKMSQCGMVESMFSLSMARGLVQLQTLEIEDCKMMESIVCTSEGGGEHEKTIAATDPIEFPKLQELTLRKLPSFITFCKAVNAIELPQLNRLNLINIPKLRNLCQPASETNCDTIIRPLFNKNRGVLILKECRSLEVLFDLGGLIVREGYPAVALLSLTIVELIHLPKLTHVWMNNSPAARIQGFNNLTSVIVKGCGSLRNLFSSSVAKLLVKLEELEITECLAMEAIISKEQRVDDNEVTTTTNTIIMFPQLTSLKLSALPNLMSFCPKGYTFEGSFLENVQVINCPKMAALPSEFQQIQEQQRGNKGFHEAIQKTDKALSKTLQFMLTSDGEFTVMEIDDTTELWKNQLEAECLHDVKRMWVQCCGKLSSVVSTSLIQKFHNLKQLKVWWCYSVGVIFDLEGLCADEGTVTQLSEMEFKYLPKLTDIWKVNFPRQTHYFQNLRSLKVKRCDSLKYIFTFSMAKVLVNLESLKVGHCDKVEKIVTKEEEEEEWGRTILLKLMLKVGSVRLKDLPSLVSFGVPFQYWRQKLQSCPKFQHD